MLTLKSEKVFPRNDSTFSVILPPLPLTAERSVGSLLIEVLGDTAPPMGPDRLRNDPLDFPRGEVVDGDEDDEVTDERSEEKELE